MTRTMKRPVSGRKYASDAMKTGEVILTVDYDKLFASLAVKALLNKTGRAQALHGAIRAKRVPV